MTTRFVDLQPRGVFRRARKTEQKQKKKQPSGTQGRKEQDNIFLLVIKQYFKYILIQHSAVLVTHFFFKFIYM